MFELRCLISGEVDVLEDERRNQADDGDCKSGEHDPDPSGLGLDEDAGELRWEEFGLTAAGELHDGDVGLQVQHLGDLTLRALKGDFVFAAHDRFSFAHDHFLFIDKP